MQGKHLDPQKVVCICKDPSGLEVGRIPAAAPDAESFISGLVRVYGHITVEYVESTGSGMKTEAEIRNRIHEKQEILKSPKSKWAAYMDESEVLRAEIDQLSWVLGDAPLSPWDPAKAR